MLATVLTLALLSTSPADTSALLPFVPQKHRIIHIAQGDLNSDGLGDVMLVTGNDHLNITERDSMDAVRSFIILTRTPNNQLHLALLHDNMILCRECGGAFGDPFSGTAIRANDFSVYHYGGASYRWSIDNVFKWSEKDKTWYLEKTVRSDHSIYEPGSSETEETVLPGSPVPITQFRQDE